MKYIALILVLGIYSCYNSNTSQNKHEHLRHVGDIPFDSQLDDPNFKPCHEDLATVYYARFSNSNLYKGEKPEITKVFMNMIFLKIEGSSGYITIRFLVNCEGKTGRFRVEQLDFDYKEKKFNSAIGDSILSRTKSLDGWIPAISGERAYDYYKYLTFKIIDNQITDILP